MIFSRGTKKRGERGGKSERKREKIRIWEIWSRTSAGSKIRKVWMIRRCQHTQRAALLTASATSLVWPRSSMPPLLTAKWKTANRDYWGEVPCRHGDKRSLLSHTHTHTNSHFDFYDSYLRGVYEKAIEAKVDILHIISHSRSLSSLNVKAWDIKQTCYDKLPALQQKPSTIADILSVASFLRLSTPLSRC